MDAARELREIERVDPVIKADELGYVVFERRDPSEMARFLDDFGFVRLEGSAGKNIYFRAQGTNPYCVKIVASDKDAYGGIGFHAASAADLTRLANASGQPIHASDEPGGVCAPTQF